MTTPIRPISQPLACAICGTVFSADETQSICPKCDAFDAFEDLCAFVEEQHKSTEIPAASEDDLASCVSDLFGMIAANRMEGDSIEAVAENFADMLANIRHHLDVNILPLCDAEKLRAAASEYQEA